MLAPDFPHTHLFTTPHADARCVLCGISKLDASKPYKQVSKNVTVAIEGILLFISNIEKEDWPEEHKLTLVKDYCNTLLNLAK